MDGAGRASRSSQNGELPVFKIDSKLIAINSFLFQLTLDINQEVKSQNSLLDNMGNSFGSVSGLFNSTIGKLGQMMGASSSHHMYYLVFFIVFVFLVLYFMMGRK